MPARAAATKGGSTAIGRISTTFHIRHLRDLVAPAFADSRLGRHLLNMWVEREPRLSGEAIAQVFMAGNHTDNTPRLNDFKVPLLVVNGEFDNSLAAGARTASLVREPFTKSCPKPATPVVSRTNRVSTNW